MLNNGLEKHKDTPNEEIQKILKMINDMSRFWDAKLVKLRNDTDTF